MKRVVVAVMSAAGAFALNAETVWKWTGEGASNSVTDQQNWVNTADGSHPGAKYSPYYGGEDVWVFDPGEGESVTLKLDHTGWPDFVIVRRLEVLSGNVTIQGDASIYGGSLQMDPAIGAATSTVHVAENATLTINAYVGAAYQASGISATSRIIAKTGKGTVTQNWTLGYGGGGAGRQPYLTLLDVRAGVFHRYSDASHYNSFVGDIYVHAGAEFGWNSYSMLEDDRDGKTQPSIHVEKGGLVRVGESSTTNVDGISGDGEWIFTGNHKIVMKLAKRDYVFGGEFKGSHLTMAAPQL